MTQDLTSYLSEVLGHLPSSPRYWIAYSAGRDSHVLLDAIGRTRSILGGSELVAVHVNHGLSAAADAWEEHCRQVCRRLGVASRVVRVDAKPGPGESPEAAARRARYDALRALLGRGELLLTAHHQQDQAETLLLQMVRGAGPRGLAAMPRCSRFGLGWLARPLLDVPAKTLATYASAARLDWVEDPSNQDTGYDRNFVRHVVLPTLRKRWPKVSQTLTRVAAHQAQAAMLADVVATTDLARIRCPDRQAISCSALSTLSRARQYNALRAWLRERRLNIPRQAHLERVVTDVVGARIDRTPLVRWAGAQVRRYRDALFCLRDNGDMEDVLQDTHWRLPGQLAFPHGWLSASPAEGCGLRRSLAESVEVAFRRGGERCRPTGRRHSQTLKKLFQERGIPPWERHRIPLIYVNGRLAAVAGLWICWPFAAAQGEPGWKLRWTPRASIEPHGH